MSKNGALLRDGIVLFNETILTKPIATLIQHSLAILVKLIEARCAVHTILCIN